MGGAAAVITIYSDKKFETSMVYNANMSHMSIHYDFLTEKDPLKRDEILKNWMKKNKAWMDKEYGQPGFAPEWYGLIIYDNYNKRIVEEQGYTSFLGAEIASLLLVLDEKLVFTNANGDEDEYYTFYEVNQMEKFLKANKLFLYNRLTKEKEILDSKKSIRDIVKSFVDKNGSLKRAIFASRLKIKHTGWEYVCFDGDNGKKPSEKPFTDFYEYCKKEYSDLMKIKDHKKWKDYLETRD